MPNITLDFDGKSFSHGDMIHIFRAVKRVLTANDSDICEANAALFLSAVHVGLVTEDECNLG